VLAIVEDAAVPEQELQHAMALAHDVLAQVLAAADDIANGFLRIGRDADGCELSRPVQTGHLRCITPVGLDSITRADGDQRGRDHIARDLHRRELPVDRVAAATGLVARAHVPLLSQSAEQAPDLVCSIRNRHGRRGSRASPTSTATEIVSLCTSIPTQTGLHFMQTGSLHAALAAVACQ
jgi:hypothetical protein